MHRAWDARAGHAPSRSAKYNIMHYDQVDLEVGERIQYKYVILEEQVRPELLVAPAKHSDAPAVPEPFLSATAGTTSVFCAALVAGRPPLTGVGVWPVSSSPRVQSFGQGLGLQSYSPH